MTQFKIAVIPGDGIGPEVTNATRQVLETVSQIYQHRFVFEEWLAGGIAIDATGEPLPPATIAGCRNSDAVLLGAVGGPQWDQLPGSKRPEKALLGLRAALGLYANFATSCPVSATAFSLSASSEYRSKGHRPRICP